MRTLRRHWLAFAVMLAAAAAGVSMLAGAPLFIRAPLVLGFAVLGPGAALVPLLGLRDPLGEVSLIVGTSLALDVIVASVLLYAHAWAPRGGLAILAGLALAGAAAQLVLAGRQT